MCIYIYCPCKYTLSNNIYICLCVCVCTCNTHLKECRILTLPWPGRGNETSSHQSRWHESRGCGEDPWHPGNLREKFGAERGLFGGFTCGGNPLSSSICGFASIKTIHFEVSPLLETSILGILGDLYSWSMLKSNHPWEHKKLSHQSQGITKCKTLRIGWREHLQKPWEFSKVKPWFPAESPIKKLRLVRLPDGLSAWTYHRPGDWRDLFIFLKVLLVI